MSDQLFWAGPFAGIATNLLCQVEGVALVPSTDGPPPGHTTKLSRDTGGPMTMRSDRDLSLRALVHQMINNITSIVFGSLEFK